MKYSTKDLLIVSYTYGVDTLSNNNNNNNKYNNMSSNVKLTTMVSDEQDCPVEELGGTTWTDLTVLTDSPAEYDPRTVSYRLGWMAWIYIH